MTKWADNTGSLLYHADNISVLDELIVSHTGLITLAYMDPPFFTNRVHKCVSGLKDDRIFKAAFDDRWPDLSTYLVGLSKCMIRIRDLLAPHGSLVVHVDPRTSHYVKVLVDGIFGDDAFASEIVWRYRRWPSKTPNFQRVHDVLLRYRKDPKVKPRWNQLYEPLAASTVATWGTSKQQAVFTETGRRERSSTTAEQSKGVPMGDVWDIGILAPIAKERTGYPTQKPEALLERVIGSLSDPGDMVLDPFAGSGTTLAVAARLGRRFVGIDKSDLAVEIIQKRLHNMSHVLTPVS